MSTSWVCDACQRSTSGTCWQHATAAMTIRGLPPDLSSGDSLTPWECQQRIDVAIEAERSAGAPPLDVDLLARALCKCPAAPFQTGQTHGMWCVSYEAGRIAAEYARLTKGTDR